MAKTNFKSVDQYLASQPAEVRGALERVRSAIRKAVPDAVEVISYQIPAYKLPGGPVLFFAGWKEHYSLYPATDGILAEFQEELTAYEVRNRTLRFPFSKPVPVRLIGRIAKFRAAEIAARRKKPARSSTPARRAAPSKRAR